MEQRWKRRTAAGASAHLPAPNPLEPSIDLGDGGSELAGLHIVLRVYVLARQQGQPYNVGSGQVGQQVARDNFHPAIRGRAEGVLFMSGAFVLARLAICIRAVTCQQPSEPIQHVASSCAFVPLKQGLHFSKNRCFPFCSVEPQVICADQQQDDLRPIATRTGFLWEPSWMFCVLRWNGGDSGGNRGANRPELS